MRTLPGSAWVRSSGSALLGRLKDVAVVRPGFLSKDEEDTLSGELEPELRRRRYEYDHWDAVRSRRRGGCWRGGAACNVVGGAVGGA